MLQLIEDHWYLSFLVPLVIFTVEFFILCHSKPVLPVFYFTCNITLLYWQELLLELYCRYLSWWKLIALHIDATMNNTFSVFTYSIYRPTRHYYLHLQCRTYMHTCRQRNNLFLQDLIFIVLQSCKFNF